MRLFLSVLAVLVCVAATCAAAGYQNTRSAREVEPTGASSWVTSARDELQAARCDSGPALMPETDQ